MDPDETLRLAREAYETWQACTNAVERRDAAEEALAFYKDLDIWMARCGVLPLGWRGERG
jgi:hypothetical protein